MRRGGPWVAAAGLFLVYAALAGGHTYSSDGFLMFEQGRSLALGGSFHFIQPVPWGGGTYTTSKYGAGPSFLYVPFIWLLSHAGVQRPFAPAQHVDGYYALIGPWLNAAETAASAALVMLLIREVGGSARAAAWGFVLFALGSPALIYARGDWAQPLSGLCWIAALYAAVRLRRGVSPGMLAALGAAVLFGVMTRAVDGTLAAITAALLVAGRPRALLAVLAAWAAGVGVTGWVDWVRFGSPLNTGYPATWTTPPLTGLAGALLSPARGLLWEFPALLLAPAGFAVLWRRNERTVALALTLACLLELANTALWQYWWGGWGWELRLYVPALPALAALAGLGVDVLPGRWSWALPGAALLLGMLAAVPPLFVDMNAGYGGFADGTAPSWQLAAYPLLGALKFLHRSGLDFFWWRASHLRRPVLAIPALLGVAGLWLMWPLLSRLPASGPRAAR